MIAFASEDGSELLLKAGLGLNDARHDVLKRVIARHM